jgi:hypothetical protein
MPLNAAAAYGMYSQEVTLSDVINTLNQAGFDNEDICMMLSPTHPIAAVVRDASIFTSDTGSNAATAGVIGWLSKFGAVLIPTVGFFIRSQAFFHALMVARDTPAICGNTRVLAGLGFSDDQADRFESQLRQVGVLIYVSCQAREKTEWAYEVLRQTGASEAAMLQDRPISMRETLAVTATAAAA